MFIITNYVDEVLKECYYNCDGNLLTQSIDLSYTTKSLCTLIETQKLVSYLKSAGYIENNNELTVTDDCKIKNIIITAKGIDKIISLIEE